MPPVAFVYAAVLFVSYVIQGAFSKSASSYRDTAANALLNTADTTRPLPVIYGTRRVGGNRILLEVTDGVQYTQQNLNMIFTLGEGEVAAINNVYMDERETSTVASVEVHKFLGSDDQLASSDLIAQFGSVSPYLPGKWTNEHRGRGVAYCYIKLVWNQTEYANGLPSKFLFDVQGKKVWDLRTQGSPSTLAFSDNPALCILDYLMSERYGCGVPITMIDEPSFVAAADYFDQLVEAYAGSPTGPTQKRYTCNGIVWPDAGYFDNLNALVTSCRSMLVFSGGKWKLVPEKVETVSTFGFTEDNIVGEWAIKKPGKRDRFNRIRAQWFNPDREWTEDLAIYPNTAHEAEDNGVVLEDEIALPFTTNYYTALHLAQIQEKVSRQGIQAEFTATMEALRCEVGDVVPITHSTPGWVAKPFRILQISLLESDEVRITAREYNASSYTLDSNSQADDPPDTNLPSPFADLTVTLGTPVSGTTELFVAGDGTVFPRIRVPIVTAGLSVFVTYFEAQFTRRSVSPTEWQDAPDVLQPATDALVYPVEDGVAYDMRVRAVTSMGNAGPWAYALNHTVIGKTELPSDVTGFSAQQNGPNVNFSWNQVQDADLAGYEIRYNDEGVTDWESAAVITSVTRGTAITNGFVPPGTWELLIKARDTSFNYSANADTATITVVNDNDIITQRQEAPDWLGVRSNMVHHWTGKLVPDSQSLASALGWEVFDQTVPNPYATCGYVAREIDGGFDDTVRVWADITSALAPDAVEPLDPQLGLDFRTAAGAYDGFENWTIGLATGRYFTHRFTFDTTDGILVFTGFQPTVDAVEYTQRDEGVAVAAGGTIITFAPPFHVTPNVQVTAQNELSPTEARFGTYDSLSTTGVRIHVFNSSGGNVGGVASWYATGV